MGNETVIKNIWQYSHKLDTETMSFLCDISKDYNKVKNYAFSRYSGIKSINKLVPGYEVLNEMRTSGLRQQLNLPVVYFEMALFEAIWDIKAMWQNLKNKIMSLTNQSETFSDDEKSYIRIILKINSVFYAVLNDKPYEMPVKAAKLDIDVRRLNNIIKRWTRKYKSIPKSEKVNTFRVTPTGYSYVKGGIKLVSRINRKRVFIPLKDTTPYKRQLNIVIMKDYIKIAVPTEKKVVIHDDYENVIYAHIGFKDMITLSNGKIYGENLNNIVLPETNRLKEKNQKRHKLYQQYKECINEGDLKKAKKIEENNLGKQKYNSQKTKEYAKTIIFINTELNKMLEYEKPCKIILTSPFKSSKMTNISKSMKNIFSRNFAGYIRERIEFKCRENGIEFIQINSKGTANICSECGAEGKKNKLEFKCEKCGNEMSSALNSAKNIEKKYLKK